MLLTVAMLLAAPERCVDVKQQCRACTSSNSRQRCSNTGIACQPSSRICQPNVAIPVSDRAKGDKGACQLTPSCSHYPHRSLSHEAEATS